MSRRSRRMAAWRSSITATPPHTGLLHAALGVDAGHFGLRTAMYDDRAGTIWTRPPVRGASITFPLPTYI